MRILSLFPVLFMAGAAAVSAASLPLTTVPHPTTTTTSEDPSPLPLSTRGCGLLSACFSSLKNTFQGASSVSEVPGRTSKEHRYSSIALSRMPSYRASPSGTASHMGSPPRPPRHSPRSKDKDKGKGNPMPLPLPMSMEKPLPNKSRPELARAKSPLIAPTVPPGEVKMVRGRGRKNRGKLPYIPPPNSGPFGWGRFGSGPAGAAAQERVWKGARDDVSAMMDGSSSQDRKSTLAALKNKNGGKKPAQA
ncbi:hypothetical protein BCV69DRAFT_570 [Microstroma glucosiphilum]|uniref:Uncharacterized protein n=1 Tax=Pseudomicrostroma glucosiphilum TaxID=1684307 RepID=A0A316UEZ5_9BASI|nr:hypothetical protein BCV69DRAFT_570 [Pseudomicrostroma glucosiphilum]PWN23484.1 hypothetical protein BCV69DRAFT_570 [Pseudomicrostroma glucosiphilum]